MALLRMVWPHYPSDLTDAEWQRLQSLIPPPGKGGRPRTLDVREVVNAILYLVDTNCGWRGIPAAFPNRASVRHYYDRWRQDGTWDRVQAALGVRS
jgi:transposase